MQPEAERPDSSAGVSVSALAASDWDRWDAFVRSRQDGTFFHLAAWEKVLRRVFDHRTHYLLACRGGEVCGVLPLAEVRSFLFGHSLVSTPFCAYGGILAADAEAFSALETRACALAHELGVDFLEMRDRARLHPGWPCRDLYVTFRRAISPNKEENEKAIPNRQRAMIRKGARNGLRAEIDETTERHYALYSKSLRNLGTPVFAKRYLDALKETFGRNCEILTVTKDGEAIASVLSFYFRDEVLPYYGGGGQQARQLAANDFMYWEVMERARQCDCRLYDYGRSKQGTGSYNFKRYWGFEPEPLYYEYHLVRAKRVPNISPTNPRYEAFIRAWRLLPLGLSRAIGPWLARALG